MILGIGKELSVFLHAILAGNLVCLVYYFLRILRRIIKHNLLAISLEDIIFWIWTGIHLFIQIYRTSDGSIRWYFVVGVLCGGIFTYFFEKNREKRLIFANALTVAFILSSLGWIL